MKHYFLLLLTSINVYLSAHQSYTYVIKTNYDSHDQIHLIGHYKGNIIDLKEGIDFLPEFDLINSFALIITTEPPTLSPEIISHLKRAPDAPCLWYDLSWTKEGTKTVWAIKQLNEEDIPPRIPENAIIIYYDPEYIEKIEDKTPQESSTVIHLPTIILKKNLSCEERKKRDEALERSALARIANNANITPATKIVKKGHAVKQARML